MKSFDDYERQLWVTKMLRRPIQTLQDTVQKIITRTVSKNDLKYLIHSAHDTQLLNLWEFFKPHYDPEEPTDATYVSTFYLELHYDANCLARSPRNTGCFTVEAYRQG